MHTNAHLYAFIFVFECIQKKLTLLPLSQKEGRHEISMFRARELLLIQKELLSLQRSKIQQRILEVWVSG